MSISTRLKELVHRSFDVVGLEIRRKRQLGPYRVAKSSNFNEEIIIADLLDKIQPKNRFYVDIGAGDGESMSNTFPLINNGWAGLAIEGGNISFAHLANRYAVFTKISLSQQLVTPHNILSLLAGHDTPKRFGFLSLDIDGYDHFVLDKILSAYRPDLICTEINERIPPPIKFAVKYLPGLEWHGGPFYGQSISMLEEMAGKHRYNLVKLEYNNAFLVPGETSSFSRVTALEAYKAGYLDKPDRLAFMPGNEEFDPAIAMPKDKALAFFRNKFEGHNDEYILE